jgi:hypothetical protein
VGGGIAFAWRRPPLASQPSADQMVVCKKAFEIFVGFPNVTGSTLRFNLERLDFWNLNF